MQSISPVFTEDEVSYEITVALDQPQYIPLISLPLAVSQQNTSGKEIQLANGEMIPVDGIIINPDFMRCVRFQLNDEEREAIAGGADLLLTEVTNGEPFTPINIQFFKTGECPKF